MISGFTPPPYPYERLSSIRELAEQWDEGAVDCSIGTPCDPPPQFVIDALGSSGLERGYPTSAGSDLFRTSASRWVERRFGVNLDPGDLAACMGTKEFVASTAQFLSLRDPSRSVVLYPEISYPTYAMGATLAGLESYSVPVEQGRLAVESIPEEVAKRALLIWSNSPSNPTGELDDLEKVAAWGREHGVLVFSDECYTEFTWDGPPRSILEYGTKGVIALHSLSKRSNLAGIRVGFYGGDPEVVGFLRSIRQHAGFMVPGPVQLAGSLAFDDDEHVVKQRKVYLERLNCISSALEGVGLDASLPQGAFYLWVHSPERCTDGWAFAEEIARRSAMIVSPGDLYGERGAQFVRIAVVQPIDRLEAVAQRLIEGGSF